MFNTFSISTKQEGMYNISAKIQQFVTEQKMMEGLCFVMCPHTTAAITINENADDDVQRDMLLGLDKISPDLQSFRHFEGNSAAHIKSSIVGCSETIAVQNGKLVLGTWQGIYFCEFDGPRNRNIIIQCIENVKGVSQ